MKPVLTTLTVMAIAAAVAILPKFIEAQPVPKQEQNSRLVRALEEHNRLLQENTQATRENTQACRENSQALRQRATRSPY